MEDNKIIKNMKEALKRTKKRGRTRSKPPRSACDTIGEELGNQLMKNWVFSSPPSTNGEKPQKNSDETIKTPDESSRQKNVVKINAFEKLMAKRTEPLSPISPEANGVKKKSQPRKSRKQNKSNNLDDEENSTVDQSSNSIRKFLHGSSTSLNVLADEDENLSSFKKKRNRNICESEVLKDDDETTEPIKTPKRRKTKLEQIELDSNENKVESPSAPDTPSTYQSGRPRRSCAGKIKYDEVLLSPPKKTGKNSTDELDDDTFVIDDESPIKPKKLAPVFVKRMPKPVIDPVIQEARRTFLLSGLPEDMRQTIDKQRQFENEILSNELVAFPAVSHVMQTDAMILVGTVDWTESCVKLSTDDDNKDNNVRQRRSKEMSLYRGRLTDCETNPLEKERPKIVEAAGVEWGEEAIKNLKKIVHQLKKEYGDFPTNRCFKQLHEKFQTFTKQQNNSQSNDENFLFVDFVKPATLGEFIICKKPVQELFNFLQTWNEKADSYDEYSDDSMSSSRQSGRGSNNFVVLTGESGSGKTLSVYSLATEMNYRVIEVNAGSRRSGKIMLQELQEATQSHRVKKTENSQEPTSSASSDDQKSIILIEDAELVFESDDGFASAIQQLINISKRPVILTTNNSSCQHLQKFINHNEIAFNMSSDNGETNHIGKYLSLLCLAANYQIDSIDIQHLFIANGRDMRKTINEIEFFIRSRNTASAALNDENDAADDDLLDFYLSNRCRRQQQIRRRPLASENRKQLTEISSMHFELSMMSSLMLSEADAAGKEDDLMGEMKCFIMDRCCTNVMDIQRHSNEGMHKIIEKKSSSSSSSSWKASTIASHLMSTQSTTNRVLSSDYSPFLRDICRSEKMRLDNGRRTSSNNRGHYLRYLIAQNSFGNDYFNEQTELFQK